LTRCEYFSPYCLRSLKLTRFFFSSKYPTSQDNTKLVATAVLSTTVRAKAREARKEAKKLGRQPSLDSTSGMGNGLGEIPMERVTSHLSTTSYLSMDAVSATCSVI